MEQPCYKCGQSVEEGRVFCPHCSAPQIRVLVAEPPVAALHPVGPAGEPQTAPASHSVPVLAVAVPWSQAFRSCALAAVVATVLMFLGLHPFVAMPSAGFLAIVFHRQGQHLTINLGAALRLGAFTGLLYFGIIALLTAVAAMFPEPRAKLREEVFANLQKLAATYGDNPQFQELVKQLHTPEGFALWLALSGVVLLVISIVLGGLGGTLAGALFRRRGQS